METTNAAAEDRGPMDSRAPHYGVYPARVADVRDPEDLGRLLVTVPALARPGSDFSAWARLTAIGAGPGCGFWFLPEPGSEVLVAFEAGDPARPYVIGALWNRGAPPPDGRDPDAPAGRKILRTRGGVQITLDDAAGREEITLETPGGQRVRLVDGAGAITLEDANGNRVELAAAAITISAAATLRLEAGRIELSAAEMDATVGLAGFHGLVKADIIITETIAAASYTPGAGNVW